MNHDAHITLILSAILLTVGSVAAVSVNSLWFTIMFMVAVVAWILRLVAQIIAK